MHDDSAGAHAVSVPCYVCGRMVRLCDALCDLDGPAFEAYYCPACVPAGEKVTERVDFTGQHRTTGV